MVCGFVNQTKLTNNDAMQSDIIDSLSSAEIERNEKYQLWNYYSNEYFYQ